MTSFNRNDKFGGNRGGGRDFGRKSFGGRDSGEKPAFKFDATCSKCGKPCQVPFRPAGDRPVFCRDCFTKPVTGNMSPRPLTSNFERPRFDSKPAESGTSLDQMKQQFGMLHAKLDAILRNLASAPTVAPGVEKVVKVDEQEVKKAKKAPAKKAIAKKKK